VRRKSLVDAGKVVKLRSAKVGHAALRGGKRLAEEVRTEAQARVACWGNGWRRLTLLTETRRRCIAVAQQVDTAEIIQAAHGLATAARPR
jgi:hypothetical protein